MTKPLRHSALAVARRLLLLNRRFPGPVLFSPSDPSAAELRAGCQHKRLAPGKRLVRTESASRAMSGDLRCSVALAASLRKAFSAPANYRANRASVILNFVGVSYGIESSSSSLSRENDKNVNSCGIGIYIIIAVCFQDGFGGWHRACE